MGTTESLKAAYMQTTYRVSSADGPIDIRIGVRNTSLDRLLAAYQVHEWAFVTASNPRSQVLPGCDNARRNADLEQMLRDEGLAYLQGSGVPADSAWPAERSFLVLGVNKTEAIAIARHWEQHAIVCGTLGGAPQLVWTD